MHSQWKIVSLVLLAAVVLSTAGCGAVAEARRKAFEIQALDHMRKLAIAVIDYADKNDGQFPAELADAAEYCKETPFDVLINNPFTGDNPGYEYVKPAEDAPITETVMIYQLRDGQRDTSLKVAYADGSVREGP